jgi:hydrogenase maturation protease
MSTRVTVIGVGNEFRRDDAVGLAVVASLRRRELDGVECAESDGEPVGLIELWQDADTAVVVDGVRTAQPRPGRVHRLSADHPSAAPAGASSSHGVDLGEAVALARTLGLMPRRLLLYAIEIADTGFGVGLSPQVASAAHDVADEIAELLRADARPRR